MRWWFTQHSTAMFRTLAIGAPVTLAAEWRWESAPLWFVLAFLALSWIGTTLWTCIDDIGGPRR